LANGASQDSGRGRVPTGFFDTNIPVSLITGTQEEGIGAGEVSFATPSKMPRLHLPWPRKQGTLVKGAFFEKRAKEASLLRSDMDKDPEEELFTVTIKSS
jgi:hypothetical protein